MNTDSKNTETKQCTIPSVSISSFIDQNKAKLLGYQAFYKDGSNKFYESIFDIENNIINNPLVDVKQVGKRY
tara:strand:- start:47 stop:262 length:216 start_codon:yes stop_codon:yes gene_type:complete